MKKNFSVTGSIILFSIFLMNCGTNSANDETKDISDKEDTIVAETPEVEIPDESVDNSGKICFEYEDEKFSNSIEIYFLENNKVKGMMYVYIHDEEMGYDVTSDSEFEGEISGDKIMVELTIEIEGNIGHE